MPETGPLARCTGTISDNEQISFCAGEIPPYFDTDALPSQNVRGCSGEICETWEGPSLASVASDGSGADGRVGSLSSSGRILAFVATRPAHAADTNDHLDVYVRDVRLRTTTLISARRDGANIVAADGPSAEPAIAGERFVAFSSHATNLVVGLGHPTRQQIYVFDRESHNMVLVSTPRGTLDGGDADSWSPTISDDGRYVAFVSAAGNLVTPGLFNGVAHVLLWDRTTGATIDATPGRPEGPDCANSSIHPDGPSGQPILAGDGSMLAFVSAANNLTCEPRAPDDRTSDILLYDLASRRTRTISRSHAGTAGNGHSWQPSITSNGRYVAFTSSSSNLLAGDAAQIQDGNGIGDVYVVDTSTNAIARVSLAFMPDNEPPHAYGWFEQVHASFSPSIVDAPSGLFVLYTTTASYTVFPDYDRTPVSLRDTNGRADVFRVELTPATLVPRNVAAVSRSQVYWHYPNSPEQDLELCARTAGLTVEACRSNAACQSCWAAQKRRGAFYGNGESHSEGPHLLSADAQTAAYSSVATNLIAPERHVTRYRCERSPDGRTSKYYDPQYIEHNPNNTYDAYVVSLASFHCPFPYQMLGNAVPVPPVCP